MTSLVDGGNDVVVIYLDSSKAFDTVPYDILISKITSYGLDKTTVRWIHSWLQNCTQRLFITGSFLNWEKVTRVVLKD